MATNLPSCFSIQFLEQLLKFLVNFTLLKYVKSQRSYDFLITKELIFGFQILDLKDHFSASLIFPDRSEVKSGIFWFPEIKPEIPKNTKYESCKIYLHKKEVRELNRRLSFPFVKKIVVESLII